MKKYQLPPITEVTVDIIFGDFTIQTDRKIKSNTKNIVVKNYKRKSSLRNYMPVPTEYSTSVKEYYEINNYEDLEIKIAKIWHHKITAVSVINLLVWSRNGQINTLTREPGSPSQYDIQKIALCRTAHIFIRVLSTWLKNISRNTPRKT